MKAQKRMSKIKRKIYLIFWIAIAFGSPLIPISIYFNNNWYSLFHSYSMGMVFGLCAFVYFLNALVLSCRIRFLDRIFGHDRIMIFHGWLASIALCFALTHVYFKWIFFIDTSLQTFLGLIGLSLLFIIMSITTLFMIDSIFHNIKIVAQLKRFIGRIKVFDYSNLKLIHNITAFAMLAIMAHVYIASSTQETIVRMVLVQVWAGLVGLLYLYHKLARPLVAQAKGFIVHSVTKHTKDIVEIVLSNPKRKTLSHKAGQFGYFRFFSKTCGNAEHPFTFSSAPGNKLSITVKNLGDYTGKLGDLSTETHAAVDGPYGIFTPQQNNKPKVFIAGGIGITPFLSTCAHWDASGLMTQTTLIWSCQTQEELFAHDIFNTYAKKYDTFFYVPITTRQPNPYSKFNRINRNLLESYLPQDHKNLEIFYCGPNSLRHAVFSSCRSLGITPSQIHYEKFSF